MRITLLFLIALTFLFCGCITENDSEKTKIESKKFETITTLNGIYLGKNIFTQNLPLEYSVLRTRNIKHELKNDSVRHKLDIWIDQNKNPSIDEMIDFSLEITSEILDFTFENTSSDLNTLLESGKANCVGYAVVFNSILNYIIDKTKEGTYPVFDTDHCVGQISINGINVHNLFTDPFFKDHDFIVINYLKCNERIAVDPSLYDYFGIKRVKLN